MALPDSLKRVVGTALVFSSTEYSPTDGGQPTGQDANLSFNTTGGTGVGASGVCWQSAKLDIGSANMDAEMQVDAYFEWHSAPTAGETANVYLAWSTTSTAGNGNPGNVSGANGVYQGYGADTASGTEALKQLEFVGSLVLTADADVHVAKIGTVVPKSRYVSVVVENQSAVALAATDAIESAVVLTPITYQVQD